MVYDLPVTLSDKSLKEIIDYSETLTYGHKLEGADAIYASAGLSHKFGSTDWASDIIGNPGEETDNLDHDQFLVNEGLPDVFYKLIDKLSFGHSVGKVRLSKFRPNCILPFHIDYNCHNITRVHLPIITNPKANYFYDDWGRMRVEHLKLKHIYALNVNVNHSIRNKGTSDRMHLIINVGLSYNEYVEKAKLLEPEEL